MHRLKRFAALRPLLTAATQKNLTSACAEIRVQRSLPSTAATLHPAIDLAAVSKPRTFATGSHGSFEPDPPSSEDRQNSSLTASTSQPIEAGKSQPDEDKGTSKDDWLKVWAKLSQKKDLEGQAQLLQDIFGETPEPVGPPLHELINYDSKEVEREERRKFELQKQAEIKQSRQVRKKHLAQ